MSKRKLYNPFWHEFKDYVSDVKKRKLSEGYTYAVGLINFGGIFGIDNKMVIPAHTPGVTPYYAFYLNGSLILTDLEKYTYVSSKKVKGYKWPLGATFIRGSWLLSASMYDLEIMKAIIEVVTND